MKAYIEAMGILSPKTIYRNLSPAQLTEHALERGEGKLSKTGALVINTGKYTGRSPDDRFIVDTPNVHDIVDWGKVNVPISRERADAIYDKMCAYMQNREVFVVDGYVGADNEYALPIRVVCENAASALFATQAFVRPDKEQLENFEPKFTVLCTPGFKCVPERDGVNSEAAIILDFALQISVMTVIPHCSSALAEQERPPSPRIQTAGLSETTSTAGRITECSISKAAAMRSA